MLHGLLEPELRPKLTSFLMLCSWCCPADDQVAAARRCSRQLL